MKKVEVIEYIPEHALQINLRKDDLEDMEGIDLEYMSNVWNTANIKRTILINGEIMAFMGGVYRSKTCHTFLMTSELVEKYPMTLIKEVKKIHNDAIKEAGITAFRTFTNAYHERPLRWLEWLGYKRGPLFKECGLNKKDRYLYMRYV